MSPDPCATPTTVPVTGPTTRWWKTLLTGRDNSTIDLGRVSWAASYLAVVIHDAFKPGSLQDLAIALAAVAGAHGIALGMKAKTEPGGEP